MEPESQNIVDLLLEQLERLILPNWSDLIAWLPLVLIVLVALFLLWLAWLWRRAGRRNRPRVAQPIASGPPPPGIHLPGPSRWPFVVPVGLALMLFALALPTRDGDAVVLPFNAPLMVIGLIVLAVAVAGWLRDAMREWRTAAHATDSAAGLLAPGTRPIAELHSGTGLVVSAPPGPPPGVHLPDPSPWPFFAPIAITLILFGLILSPVLVVGGLILSLIAIGGWLRDAGREYRSTEQVGHVVSATRDPRAVWPRRLVPVFAVVIALSVLITLAPLGIAWLDSRAPGGPTTAPVAVPEVPEITARTVVSFEVATLVVPCCRPFELIFHNEQAGVPHNVEIADSPARTNIILDGADITGVETITYQVPELAEGDYYFLCRIHPNMNGTVQARPEAGSP